MINNILGFINFFIPPPISKYLMLIRGVHFKRIQNTWIGSFCQFDNEYPELIQIGSGVIVSYGVKIICHFEPTRQNISDGFNYTRNKVVIGNGVFVGAGVIVYPGVKIGDNCIISAGVILTKSISPNTIVKLKNTCIIHSIKK